MLLTTIVLFALLGLAVSVGPILFALGHSARYGHRPDDVRPSASKAGDWPTAVLAVTPVRELELAC